MYSTSKFNFLFSSRCSIFSLVSHRFVRFPSPVDHRQSFSATPRTLNSPGPLHGIRILDLSRILAGPFATMLLADYGAEVIKVEMPDVGDDTRKWGPPFPKSDAPEASSNSAYYLSVNRNKMSLTCDLKHPSAAQILQRLVPQCDVIVHNFLPGKEQRLGLDYETLSAMNPRLIYCTVSGFGQSGVAAQRPAYDVMVAAMGGLISITGEPQGPPSKAGVALTDVCTGLLAHGAINAALLEREKSNKGQRIDTSLLETQFACLVNIASNWLVAQKESPRMGTAHASIVPYQGFQTATGWMVFGALNQGQWERLCPVLFGAERGQTVAKDPRFSSNPQRVKHRDILVPMIQETCRSLDRTALLARLIEVDIPCAPINSVAEAFDEQQARDLSIVEEYQHPVFGPLHTVRPPATFSRTPAAISRHPPLLGEHTDHILSSLCGFSQSEIDQLRMSKCI